MADDSQLYVARPADLDALQQHWSAAAQGTARLLRLVAPFGGGRRALVGELVRRLRGTTDEPVVWRLAPQEQETGVSWLVRAWGSLVGPLAADPMRRGKAEMVLNGQLPSQTRRVQGWYEQFVATLKDAKIEAATGQVQLRIPQDNPMLGLSEIVLGLGRKMPILLELQAAHLVHSVLPAMWLEALLDEARKEQIKLLVVIYDEPGSEIRSSTHPAPLLDLYTRRAEDIPALELAAWGAEDAASYLTSKGYDTAPAAELARIAGGRIGYIVELADLFAERGELGADLSSVTLASLAPLQVDEDELEAPPAEADANARKHATAEDALRVAHVAALLGQIFPAALIAEMGGYDRDSVDDLLDAMGGLFEEVQFNEQMGTWLYRFKKGSFREGILQLVDDEEGRRITVNVAGYMERFLVPRGPAFMAHTSRTYAQGGAYARAAAMRAVTLTNDQPDAWGMAYDFMRYFDEVKWTDVLRRSVLTSLLEHLVQGGPLQQADQVHTDATAWATTQSDRDLQGWLLLVGSKLDARRQDYFRARDRAADAIKVFDAQGQRPRIAEVYAHLATVELQDGQSAAAISAADKALEYGSREEEGRRVALPAILAQSELIRGAVARREGRLDEAQTHFRQANEVAGAVGLAPMALEAGIALGETMAAGGKPNEAREILGRVLVATRQIGAVPRERNAAQLLAQLEGQRGNFKDALQLSQRVLQITQQLRFEGALAADLFHVGFFTLAQNQGKDALPFFQESLKRMAGQDNHPMMRDLHYYAGVAALQAGQLDLARQQLRAAAPRLQAAGDTKKLLSALENLALLEQRAGNKPAAVKLLQDAVQLATQADLKDERRELRKRLESLEA